MTTLRMLLLATLASAGCHGSPVAHDTDTGETEPVQAIAAGVKTAVVNIRFDETASHEDLQIRWLQVSDSRCPRGATCIRAGEVGVTLEVRTTTVEGNAPVELQLSRPIRGQPLLGTIYGQEFELLDVVPYPLEGVTPARSDYTAEIRISRIE